jgi:ribosomal protein L7/L12
MVNASSPAGLDADIRAAADQGDLIGAIKLLRQRSGAGLNEAMAMVDAYRRGQQPHATTSSAALPLAAIVALQEGKLIEAIRHTREARALGLKESKDAVERYLCANPASREQFRIAARANRRFPWLAVMIVAALVALAVAWLRA